jgi:hypothetical protein
MRDNAARREGERLIRRLFTLLSALSLLLCLGTCVLWVGSYWWRYELVWDTWADSGEFPQLLSYQARVSKGSIMLICLTETLSRFYDNGNPQRVTPPVDRGMHVYCTPGSSMPLGGIEYVNSAASDVTGFAVRSHETHFSLSTNGMQREKGS